MACEFFFTEGVDPHPLPNLRTSLRRSTLFMYEEPKSSVRYCSSCLQSEARFFLYATWHSVIPLENEFGIGLYLCIYYENTENFGQERTMMLGGLNYSCMRNQNLQCVTVVVACGQRSDPFYMLHGTLSYGRRMGYEIIHV